MPRKDDGAGVWVTHFNGESVTVFSSEIAALREAVPAGKQVTRLPYGVALNTHLFGAPKAATTEEGTTE